MIGAVGHELFDLAGQERAQQEDQPRRQQLAQPLGDQDGVDLAHDTSLLAATTSSSSTRSLAWPAAVNMAARARLPITRGTPPD